MLEFRSTWFLRVSSVALLLLRDDTGKPRCDCGLGFSVGTRKMLSGLLELLLRL